MKRWIAGLGALLIAQIGLAVALNMGGDRYTAFTPNEKLAAIEPAQVDTVLIETADKKVVLKKNDGKWQLPGQEGFPANQQKVTQLLDTLAGLKKGWPVATTAGAAKRFKVDEDEFERRITLEHNGNRVAQLYFGTSPGLRKVHARAVDQDDIVTVSFSLFDARADSNDWIDNKILNLDEKTIRRIDLPGLALQKQDGRWQVAELTADEETVTEQAENLVKKLSGLTVQSLFTAGEKPELEKDTKPLKIAVTLEGDNRLEYSFSKLKKSGYLLQRSDRPMQFEVAEWEVDPIKEAEREKLVRKRAPTEASDDNSKEEDKAGNTSEGNE